MVLGEYADKFKKWVSRYGTAPPEPHRLTPLVEDPSGSEPAIEPPSIDGLPKTLDEIPDHQDESSASIWAQIFCGSGNVRSQRIPSAQSLHERKLGQEGRDRLSQFGMSLDASSAKGQGEKIPYLLPSMIKPTPNKQMEDLQQEELIRRLGL
jgi:hypothetical protein